MEVVRVVEDQGQGRTFIFIHEADQYPGFVKRAAAQLSEKVRSITVECPLITDSNWSELVTSLVSVLEAKKVRQCAFVGFGAASVIVQHLVLTVPKVVRLIVLVDATFRPHPNLLQRAVDWFERILPLGLPLRFKSEGFDFKPFAQRIRCPALIIFSHLASAFIRDQAMAIGQRIPSAWVVSLDDDDGVSQFCQLVDQFESVPVKCPQKNRASSAG